MFIFHVAALDPAYHRIALSPMDSCPILYAEGIRFSTYDLTMFAGGELTKCDDMFSRFDILRTDGHLAIAYSMHTRRAVKRPINLSIGIRLS